MSHTVAELNALPFFCSHRITRLLPCLVPDYVEAAAPSFVFMQVHYV